MSRTIKRVYPLGLHWPTSDPFLFCAHHNDIYPAGNDDMGPNEELVGRHLGQDFSGKDGWSMYHGQKVPGFPHHPHRGFETVTIARKGYIDHRDSLGATSRFGAGDVQWMTAGKGVVHSEMFPLVNTDKPNPMEIFQIWLNLPRANKMVDPSFTMLWNEDVPVIEETDENGKTTTVRVVAGSYRDEGALTPPPDSWASAKDSSVGIWTITMEPGARWALPAAGVDYELSRNLYFFEGSSFEADDESFTGRTGLSLAFDAPLALRNTGDSNAEFLLLEGRPIREPVAQQGPFVMNEPGEIREAMTDYQRTGFGGWPWDAGEEVHPREKGRFAIHVDGREEIPDAG